MACGVAVRFPSLVARFGEVVFTTTLATSTDSWTRKAGQFPSTALEVPSPPSRTGRGACVPGLSLAVAKPLMV